MTKLLFKNIKFISPDRPSQDKRDSNQAFQTLKMSARSITTFSVFSYKQPLKDKQEEEEKLTPQERAAGINYKSITIKTKDVSYPRFKVTQKAKRKKVAAEKLIKRPPGYVSTERLTKRQRNLLIAKERANKDKETVKRELTSPMPLDNEVHPTHFTFGQLVGQNVHIGHRANKLDPRTLYYMGGLRNGLYVINLLQTVRGLKAGLHNLAGTVANRGKILFSNIDKRVYSSISEATKNFCLRYSIAARKLPGVLTNFLLVRYHFPGLARTSQVPMFTLALNKYDHHVIIESDSLKLPSIGIFDSNSNPFSHSSYTVAGNDESVMTQSFYLRLVFRALKAGHQLFILKWLKKRGQFADHFFKLFHFRIYRPAKHGYKMERLKMAYFFTFYELNNKIKDNNFPLYVNNDKSFFSKTFNRPGLLMSPTDMVISRFIFNYFIRQKLFLFLYKQMEAIGFNPVFHLNLMGMSSFVTEILYPNSYIKESVLYPYSNLLNAFPTSLRISDHSQSSFDWAGASQFNKFIDTKYAKAPIDSFTEFHFIKNFCFSNYFLYNARMDRFGWGKNAIMTKKIVYKFLNFFRFRKHFLDNKIAEYRFLAINKHILKPARYMYRKHRIKYLDPEMEKNREKELSSSTDIIFKRKF